MDNVLTTSEGDIGLDRRAVPAAAVAPAEMAAASEAEAVRRKLQRSLDDLISEQQRQQQERRPRHSQPPAANRILKLEGSGVGGGGGVGLGPSGRYLPHHHAHRGEGRFENRGRRSPAEDGEFISAGRDEGPIIPPSRRHVFVQPGDDFMGPPGPGYFSEGGGPVAAMDSPGGYRPLRRRRVVHEGGGPAPYARRSAYAPPPPPPMPMPAARPGPAGEPDGGADPYSLVAKLLRLQEEQRLLLWAAVSGAGAKPVRASPPQRGAAGGAGGPAKAEFAALAETEIVWKPDGGGASGGGGGAAAAAAGQAGSAAGEAGSAAGQAGSAAAASGDFSLVVRFKNTDVLKVKRSTGEIVLDSGGWRTLSTRVLLNAALKPLGLSVEEVKAEPGSGKGGGAEAAGKMEDVGEAAGGASGAGNAAGGGGAKFREWRVVDSSKSYLVRFVDGLVIGPIGPGSGRAQLLARASVINQHLRQLKSNVTNKRMRLAPQ